MGTFLLALGEFLAEHYELVNAIMEAIQGGTKKEDILKAIRASAVATSDAVVEAELGPRS